jgi:uncharacterized protein YjeT (DUF2065 family)
MSRAGRSFFWFGFWVLGCGLTLALFPSIMMRIAHITASSDIMLRVFGTVLLYMAIFYFVAGRRRGFEALYRASIYTRFSAPVVVGAFVLILKASPLIFIFTAVDALGALWTAIALRRDHAETGRAS